MSRGCPTCHLLTVLEHAPNTAMHIYSENALWWLHKYRQLLQSIGKDGEAEEVSGIIYRFEWIRDELKKADSGPH